MTEGKEKTSYIFGADNKERREKELNFAVEEDWQVAVLKNKNTLLPFDKLKL